jgi:sodium bicarbonate transporter 10
MKQFTLQVREALLRRHRHQHERRKEASSSNMSRLPIIRSLAEIGRNHSSSKSKSHHFNTSDIVSYVVGAH